MIKRGAISRTTYIAEEKDIAVHTHETDYELQYIVTWLIRLYPLSLYTFNIINELINYKHVPI